jgi:hypothetical protein
VNNIEFVKKLKDIANNHKTLYVMGCFGAPMTETNKKRYIKHHPYNQRQERTKIINAATADTFGFDCVCLIKGVLWGWDGNKNDIYGGADYAVNGVPDIDCDDMFTACSGKSSNFSNIEIGEAVWMDGHIGVYIGDGLAVECSPAWDNDVQITACNKSVPGYNRRNWTKHGKLPYITYVKETAKEEKKETKEVCDVTLPVLKKGAKSGYVTTVQILLNKYNNAKLDEDGSFGPATYNAVVAYQKSRNLIVDGAVGPQTWAQLLK